jgi:hypothetical protein
VKTLALTHTGRRGIRVVNLSRGQRATLRPGQTISDLHVEDHYADRLIAIADRPGSNLYVSVLREQPDTPKKDDPPKTDDSKTEKLAATDPVEDELDKDDGYDSQSTLLPTSGSGEFALGRAPSGGRGGKQRRRE